MTTRRAIRSTSVPVGVQTAFDDLGKYLDNVAAIGKGPMLDAANDALQRAIDGVDALADKYDTEFQEREDAEEKIEKFEERLSEITVSNGHFSLLGKLRDPANWKGNTWSPVEWSIEKDIVLFLDEAFKEV